MGDVEGGVDAVCMHEIHNRNIMRPCIFDSPDHATSLEMTFRFLRSRTVLKTVKFLGSFDCCFHR